MLVELLMTGAPIENASNATKVFPHTGKRADETDVKRSVWTTSRRFPQAYKPSMGLMSSVTRVYNTCP